MKRRVSRFAGAHAAGFVGGRFERAQARRADRDDRARRARAPHRWRRRSRPECDSARRASRCAARSSVSTGWNVPAPTCSVTNAVAMPAAASCAEHRLVEVQSRGRRRGGARHGAHRRSDSATRRRLRRRARCTAAAGLRRSARDNRRAGPCPRAAGERIVRRARRRSRAHRPASSSVPPGRGGWLARSWNTASSVGELALEQQLDAAAGRPPREEPRLDHSRVVEHHKIAAIDKPRKIGEREVFAAHVPSTCSSLLSPRLTAGACAMSSDGSS